MLETVKQQTADAIRELLTVAKLRPGAVVVIGCSSSEIAGETIGTGSAPEVAEAVFAEARRLLSEAGLFLAAQCCEHLNRAIVIERAAAERYGWEPVNAVPQVKAGGSFATAAYRGFSDPVVIETVRADAGLDIGDTLIGMHLKPVAVPVRLAVKTIGNAHLTAARVRPKFVGGSRAVYDENLL